MIPERPAIPEDPPAPGPTVRAMDHAEAPHGANASVPGRPEARERSTALRLARLHLRTGSLSLARAELEAAAGAGQLDGDALLDLAEVRWRTADVIGAGEAADAYLDAGGDALVALIVAAEAATMSGGSAGAVDAEVLVGRVLERARLPLDRIVAGMLLMGPWPAGMDVALQPPEATRDLGAHVDPGVAGRPIAPLVPVGAAHAAVRASGGGASPADAAAADPLVAFAAGTEALAVGDREAAAFHLAVALRLSPALAPAILASVGGTPGAAFDLLRGDAFRLVGHESDARRAYAAVARSLGERREAAPHVAPDDAPVDADTPAPDDAPVDADTPAAALEPFPRPSLDAAMTPTKESQ
jgi:hypothetical protein